MFFINQPLFLQKLSIYIHTQIFIWDWDLNLGRKEFKVLINLKIHINGCYWLWLWMPQNEHPDENIPFHLKQKGGVVLPLSNGLLWPWNNYNLWLGKTPLIKNSYVAKMVLLSDWLLGWPFKNQILSGLDISIEKRYYSKQQSLNETTFPNFQIFFIIILVTKSHDN